VGENYLKLAKLLLDEGVEPAFATHDGALVAEILEHVRARGIGPERFEFQMLYGIRRDLQQQLAADGWRVRLYIPYGDAWYPYFMRRMAERPANAFFVVKNLLRT
jgi:proline dehydrogenase